jgi:UDP-glucose:(heptosyl)LPS alpha-1,3-glucosyltransferase
MRIGLSHKRLDLKGGTERDLYVTAAGLRDLGHEVHLFCGEFAIAPPVGTFRHKVPTVPLGRSARLLSFAAWAPNIVRRYDCAVVVNFGRMVRQDVLRSGGGPHKIFLEKLARESGRARRIWQSLSPYHRSLIALERRQYAAGHFKRVLAVSQLIKGEIIATYGVPERKITVLYNGVDHERFHPSLRVRWRNPVREEWGIPREAPVVLFVGNGFRRKGLDRLLRVWQASRLVGAYLLVVGDDTSLATYRASTASQLGGRVVFAGGQEHVDKYYAAADLLALPALQEAFGNVVLEGLASGLPVVVSRNVGAAEILRDGLLEGVVDKPDDSQELEAKLVTMLERSAQPNTAVEARCLAEEYSWKNHFEKLEACLVQVSRQGDGRPLI